MRLPALDERLRAVAELFTACDIGADIGADHGRLSCYLLDQRICRRMIVSDISADSLAKARRLLALHGLDDKAEFEVADGLDALAGPVDVAAICGMGGKLVSGILLRGKDRLQNAAFVLSCHTDIPLLRRTIGQIGYHISRETLVRAHNRFYIVMRAEPGCREPYSEKELYLGPLLMRERPPLWTRYLKWREGVVQCEQGHDTQLQWIREELNRETAEGEKRS